MNHKLDFMGLCTCCYASPLSSRTSSCSNYILDLGALNACTLPLSTPAKGSMLTLIRVGCLPWKAALQAEASCPAFTTP